MKLLTRVACRSLVAVVCFLPVAALAQESKSAPLAKQLAAALDAGKLDSIAAHDPSAPDIFVAALYFPGLQLLVVSGKYAVPQLLNDRVGKKEYRDVYLDLNGASVADTPRRSLKVRLGRILALPPVAHGARATRSCSRSAMSKSKKAAGPGRPGKATNASNAKIASLTPFMADGTDEVMTTNQGV